MESQKEAMLVEELIQTTALACNQMDNHKRLSIIRFVRSCWNPDGGVQDRERQSDICYTAYAAICMRALRGRMPLLRLWRYIHSFNDGESLDIQHLFCLIRLYTMFPMTGKTRQRLLDLLEMKQAESSSEMFFKVVMAEYLNQNDRPNAHLTFTKGDSTSDLAASIVVNHRPDKVAEDSLMQRYCKSGGFCYAAEAEHPDLFSTATALFALRVMNVDLSAIRAPCLKFVESQQRESGGFAADTEDTIADTENTFYALLSLGCLAD